MKRYCTTSENQANLHGRLRQDAEQLVLRDLVNASLHENLLGCCDRGTETTVWPGGTECGYPLKEGERYFCLPVDESRTVVFRVHRQQFIQDRKISRLPVVLLTQENGCLYVRELGPVEFMRLLADSSHLTRDGERDCHHPLPNLPDFLQELTESVKQTALSREAMLAYEGEQAATPSPLNRIERFSSFRDRPFHPTSRAKRGWNADDYRAYSPEFGNAFGLDWLAVRRDFIRTSTPRQAAEFVIGPGEQEQLRQAARRAGVDEESHVLLPIHPWQMTHVLPSQFRAELDERIIIPVIRGLGRFTATSSVRALTPEAGGTRHVKVPLGIYSLGALRILPPRYLHNGQKGQQLLERLIQRDPWLGSRLRVCDESRWWAFCDSKGDPFADKPGHLACLVREYPGELIADPHTELIAMSALAVLDSQGTNPLLDRWLDARFGRDHGKTQVLHLFREIAREFVEAALHCFRYGVMPEVHGQNVMLIVRNGRVDGLLLRDHDTVRLHLPWLTLEGLPDPGYIVKPGTPNSLTHNTPEQLLSYFQTLGLQVNLYAIMDAWSQAFAIEETAFWREVEAVIRDCLCRLDFPPSVRSVIEQQLMESGTWPTRVLLGPLLKRTDTGGGSMPAGVGATANPLRRIGEEA